MLANTIAGILALIAASSAHTMAQSASSVWALTANPSPVLTGQMTATDQTFSNMQASYVSGVQRSSPSGTPGSWPQESAENGSRYMQFSAGPLAGYTLAVSSISMSLFAAGGSNMKANVYFSKDSTFSSRTQIGSTLSLAQSSPASPNASASPALVLNGGERLYVRVYPWYTASATGKHIIATGISITGNTTPAHYIGISTDTVNGFLVTSEGPSASKSYTIAGYGLSGDVSVIPPLRFELSKDGGASWKTHPDTLMLPASGGTIVGQPVTMLVRYVPVIVSASYGDIVHASIGIEPRLVHVSGVRLADEPTAAAVVSFGPPSGNAIEVKCTGGNGARRVIVVRPMEAVNWTPTDGRLVSGVNSNLSDALDQGLGNRIAYDGADTIVSVTGLVSNLTYHVAVFEYNVGPAYTQNYLAAAPGRGSCLTLAVPTLYASPASIDFGSYVANKDSAVRTYVLTGSFLSGGSGSIALSAPAGYLVSLSINAEFSSSLQVPFSTGAISATTVYVKFIPTAWTGYAGAITHSGGGVTSFQVQINGKGVSAIVDISGPTGFASLGGGTTGGAGGTSVIITDAQQLADILRARESKITTPLIVYVSGTISGYSTEISVKRTANMSILGVGMNAGFQGFGMKIVECSNIMVRNMTFSDCKVDEKDGIAVDGSSNVWIDHCSFTDSPSSDPSGGSHDGQLDVKNGSYNVTLSYNHFMNHRKTCLLGHSPGQASDSVMKVTYYRNWFDGTYSRHPRIRYAKTHIVNNLYSNTGVVGSDAGGYGVGVTCGAQVLVESNYFENTPKPVLISQINDPGETLSGDPIGSVKAVNNVLSGSGPIVENLEGYSFNPASYYDYSTADAALVKTLVMQNAGAGLLNISTSVAGPDATPPVSFTLEQNVPNPFNPATTINYQLPITDHVSLKVFDILGREVAVLVNGVERAGSHSVTWSAEIGGATLSSGIYLYRLQSGGRAVVKRMVLMR